VQWGAQCTVKSTTSKPKEQQKKDADVAWTKALHIKAHDFQLKQRKEELEQLESMLSGSGGSGGSGDVEMTEDDSMEKHIVSFKSWNQKYGEEEEEEGEDTEEEEEDMDSE
jgi:hypothetical protein